MKLARRKTGLDLFANLERNGDVLCVLHQCATLMTPSQLVDTADVIASYIGYTQESEIVVAAISALVHCGKPAWDHVDAVGVLLLPIHHVVTDGARTEHTGTSTKSFDSCKWTAQDYHVVAEAAAAALPKMGPGARRHIDSLYSCSLCGVRDIRRTAIFALAEFAEEGKHLLLLLSSRLLGDESVLRWEGCKWTLQALESCGMGKDQVKSCFFFGFSQLL